MQEPNHPASLSCQPDREPLEQKQTAHVDSAAATGFVCYICGEPSTEICIRCTRDTCSNHICEACAQCSDCCVCGG